MTQTASLRGGLYLRSAEVVGMCDWSAARSERPGFERARPRAVSRAAASPIRGLATRAPDQVPAWDAHGKRSAGGASATSAYAYARAPTRSRSQGGPRLEAPTRLGFVRMPKRSDGRTRCGTSLVITVKRSNARESEDLTGEPHRRTARIWV
jgi:hypothetical protein